MVERQGNAVEEGSGKDELNPRCGLCKVAAELKLGCA
jgi:hypothetical protein